MVLQPINLADDCLHFVSTFTNFNYSVFQIEIKMRTIIVMKFNTEIHSNKDMCGSSAYPSCKLDIFLFGFVCT